jgi:hypothetical protein
MLIPLRDVRPITLYILLSLFPITYLLALYIPIVICALIPCRCVPISYAEISNMDRLPIRDAGGLMFVAALSHQSPSFLPILKSASSANPKPYPPLLKHPVHMIFRPWEKPRAEVTATEQQHHIQRKIPS